jgi:hypothetical protein
MLGRGGHMSFRWCHLVLLWHTWTRACWYKFHVLWITVRVKLGDLEINDFSANREVRNHHIHNIAPSNQPQDIWREYSLRTHWWVHQGACLLNPWQHLQKKKHAMPTTASPSPTFTQSVYLKTTTIIMRIANYRQRTRKNSSNRWRHLGMALPITWSKLPIMITCNGLHFHPTPEHPNL